MDAIRAMEGIGPGRAMSHIRRLGLVVAGYDAVAVDATCCRIAGVDPREVKHVILAARHGLGNAKAGEIDVTGVGARVGQRERLQAPAARASTG